MVDYRIETTGTFVTMLTERATNRGQGSKPKIGWGIGFKTKSDTERFVQAGEAEGFTFEGKEHLTDS